MVPVLAGGPPGHPELIDAAVAYRQYAPELLGYAASRGSPGATYKLAEEHADRGLLSSLPVLSLFELVPREPQRAYAHAYAHEQAHL
jgi:hypothetical protein